MEELIREYAEGYQLLRQSIEGLSAEELAFKPAAEQPVLDAEQHLQLFRLLRESFLPVLRRVSEEEWERMGLHSEAGPLTLRQLLERYVHHVRDHLRQIERVREACRG
jgi:ferric iron reductase protein FhuF